MTRLLRSTGLVAVATAVSAAALVATPAHAEVDELLCPGTPVWTGALTEDQPVSVLTTVRGTTPIELTGVYLDTIEDSFGHDILLVDVSGAPVTTPDGSRADAGIWSGMSGSPVHDADGNLVGAVAYSFTGSAASTIAGVTPAKDMLTMGDSDDDFAARVAVPRSVAKAADIPVGTKLERMSGRRVMAGGATPAQRTASGYDDFTGKTRLRTDGSLGTATLADVQAAEFVPGGNIAASWSSGALMLASVGTVTVVCGDRVFAFGHPDESIGSAAAQTIHHASTLKVFADDAYSYKMVSIDPDPAGSLVFDGNSGIVGEVDRPITSVPVTTEVKRGSATVGSFDTQVSERQALGFVVANQVFGALATPVGHTNGPADVTTELTIELRDDAGDPYTLERRLRTATTSDTLAIAASEAAMAVELLMYGVDEEVTVDSVDVVATINSTQANTYRLSSVEYRTGKTLTGATWKPATAKSGFKVKKGHKLEVRYVTKKSGSSTTRTTSAHPVLTTTSKFSSTGSIRAESAEWGAFEEDEWFYEDEEDDGPLGLEDALTYLTEAPDHESVFSTLSYKNPKKRSTYGFVGTDPAVVLTGALTVPITFTK